MHLYASLGQVTVQGYVKTADSLPVINANVLLHNITSAANVLVAFTKTNSKGFYSLEITDRSSSYSLTVRYSGYQEERKVLEKIQNDSVINLSYFLHPSVSFLDTVKVNLKFSISKTGDTLTFNPDAYALKNERNIEQLLSRLPGMEIREDGKILFNGKAIDAVLIEGDDLFKKNYQLLTQNAASEIVDKIQVIKNFQKDQLLKEFGRSGDQVINLVLKDKYKKYLFGNISAGYGSSGNQSGDVFLIKLFPGVKMQAGASYNTRGETYVQANQFVPEDYLAALNDYFSFSPVGSFVNIRPYYFSNIPLYYQKDNESVRATSNVLVKSKKWENLLNAKFAYDELNQSRSGERIFDDGSVLTDRDSGRVKDQLWNFAWTSSKSTEKESIYFKTSLTAKKQWDHLASLSNYSLNSTQALKGENLIGQAGLNYFRKINKDILWTASAGYFGQSLQDRLITTPDILFWQFPFDLSLYSFHSEANNKINYSKLKSGLTFNRKLWIHELEISFSSENRFITSDIMTKRLADDSSGIAFANDSYLRNKILSVRYETSLLLKKGKILSFNAQAGENFYHYKAGNTPATATLFVYDYFLNFRIKKRNSDLNNSIGLKKSAGTNEMFAPEFLQTGYHELQSGLLDLKGITSLYLQSNYNLTSLKFGWMAFGMASYSHGRSNFVEDVTNIGIGMVRSMVFHPGNVDQFLLMMNSDKTLGALPFHLKSNISFTYSAQAVSYRSNISNSGISSLKFSNQVKSHFKSVINGDYSFTLFSSVVQTYGVHKNKSSTNTFLHKANITLTGISGVDLTTSFTNMINRKIHFDKSFWDITLSRKFWKEKWLAEFSVRNLLNVKYLSNRQVSAFYIQEQRIDIRGRDFFLLVKYTIK